MKKRLAFTLLLMTAVCSAADAMTFTQGPQPPTNVVDDSVTGQVAWTIEPSPPPLGTASIGSLASGTVTQYLKVTGFGFEIPKDSLILGIEVDVTRDASMGLTDTVTDHAVRLVKADTVTDFDESNATAWPTSATSGSYGGSSDLWDNSWSAADIDDDGFGFAISAETNATLPRTVNVEDVEVTVYYSGCPLTPAAGCISGFAKAMVAINEKVPNLNKSISIRMTQGPTGIAQTDFGNPLYSGGTAYDFCVFKNGASLAVDLRVDRPHDSTCNGHFCWQPIGDPPPFGKGYRYRDPGPSGAISDGLISINLSGGTNSPAKINVTAKNRDMTLPLGGAAALGGATSAVIQVIGNDAADCFEATASDVTQATPTLFRAK